MRGLRLRIGDAWWSALGAIGLPNDRWLTLPGWQRRLVVGCGWGGLGLLLVALFGHWATSAVVTVVIALAVLVPRYRGRHGRAVVPLAVLGLAISYPFYLPHMFEMPIFGPFPIMNTMVVMAIFAMMAIGLNIVVGYAGLLDLGYVAFYAIGAYTAAWFASPHFGGINPDGSPKRSFNFGGIDVPVGIGGFHISIWLLLIAAACITALAGVIIGLPTLRLRGDYLAIVTLGFGEILPQIARNGDNLFNTGFNLTAGPPGINPLDPPGFGHTLERATGGVLPANFLTESNSLDLFWWTAIALILITIFCSIRLRDSRLGRAWIAIREDETAAAAMGVPLMRTKTWSYAAGAFFGGVAGAYFASYKSGVFPDDFFFNISVFILCMVILGGMGNIWGVILAAAFLTYLDKEGLANMGGWINENFDTSVDLPLYAPGIYGGIIVLIMLLRPQGLIPEARRKLELEQGVHDEPLYDVTADGEHLAGTTH
jgi:branched-chain amino acid transport system permease protein